MSGRPGSLAVRVAIAWVLGRAAVAAACPVCFGAAEGPMIDGAKMSVIFLGILVYTLLTGVALAIFLLRRHLARLRVDDPRHNLKLVRGTRS